MLPGIVRFEWRYHVRRLTFAVAAVFFAFMGFVLAATRFGAVDVRVNSPFAITHTLGLVSLMSVFALTLFSAQSTLRDSEHRMAEIVYSTAVTKARYLLGRFAGSLLAGCAAFAFVVPGMLAGTFLTGHDPARIAPFHALDYLWPFLVLAVPDMVLVGALLFAVATLTRSTMATYVAGVTLYMLYFVAATFADSPLIASSSPPTPEGLALAAMADPFGLSAFFEQTHYWTVVEKNAQRLALTGHFLVNRLLWTGVAVLVLGAVHRLFAFRLPAGAKDEGADAEALAPALAGYCSAPVEAERPAAQARALASAARLELRHALAGWPFVALVVAWAAMTVIELGQQFGHAEFGTALVPATGLVINRIQVPLALIGLLAVLYFSAELVWRERAVHMDEIVDASPASNAVFLVSKAAALAALVVLLTAVAVGVAAVFQLARGASPEWGLYAAVLYFTGLPLALVAVLALFLQTVSPNRYAGMLATLAAVVVLHKGGFGLIRHPLLRWAAAPEVPYSELNGFSPAAVSFHWFMAYWTAVAALVALVTCGVWRRGAEARPWRRPGALPRQWARSVRWAFLAGALAAATLGASVFYQTNVAHAYETAAEVDDFKADYERAYRHLEEEAQPSVVHVEADVDLYPEERRFRVRGRYSLRNRTREPIGTIWVTVRRDLDRAELTLAGAAPSGRGERFATYSFELSPPLSPGASTELAFDLAARRWGATAGDPDTAVVENGSFLLSTFVLPTLGYRRSRELKDPAARRRRGLAEHSRPATIEAAESAGDSGLELDRATFETTVSTSADQIAVAPGTLAASWESGGRRFFRYASDRPVTAYFAWVSARYAVERTRHGGVDVEVYYHPEHGANVPRFVAAMTRSLDSFTRRFGPYPLPQLRLVEIPSYWSFAGLALPGIVYFVEDRGFLTDASDAGRVDVVTKRVAHEVAHQWWGHQLSPARLPGASTLVESLARYSELVVLAELHGEAATAPVLEVELDRYLRGRAGAREVPLYQVLDEPWLYYSKGALVMMAVRDLVGEEAVDRALASLLTASADSGEAPTSVDLLDQLRRVTPEEDRELLDQWWKEVVVYDLRVASASSEALPDGRYRVTLDVEAGKYRVRDGEEEALDMDEMLDVAVYVEHPNAAGSRGPISAGKHRIRGATELSIMVGERPGYVAVDPFVLRIDRNRADNVRKVDAP